MFLITSIGLFLSTAEAQQACGTFLVVKGNVKIQRSGQTAKPAKLGAEVFAGDQIATGADGRGTIEMLDKSIMRVMTQSQVTIDACSQEGAAKNVELQLKEGGVFNNVQKGYDGKKNKFLIKTPTAVAGVRGTQFLTSYDKISKVTEVVTREGRVSVTSFGAGAKTVIVQQGQMSSVGADKVPDAPVSAPQDKMQNIEVEIQETAPAAGAAAPTVDAPAAETVKKDQPKRIDDKRDQSPDTFESLPDGSAVKAPPAAPTFRAPPPPTKNLVNDAIRNKTDKTRVIIRPTQPNN